MCVFFQACAPPACQGAHEVSARANLVVEKIEERLPGRVGRLDEQHIAALHAAVCLAVMLAVPSASHLRDLSIGKTGSGFRVVFMAESPSSGTSLCASVPTWRCVLPSCSQCYVPATSVTHWLSRACIRHHPDRSLMMVDGSQRACTRPVLFVIRKGSSGGHQCLPGL